MTSTANANSTNAQAVADETVQQPGSSTTDNSNSNSASASATATAAAAAAASGAKSLFGKAKLFGKKMVDQANDRLSMEGQLKQASISLSQFLSPELEVEQQIPVQLLDGAKGVVFLSTVKGGMGVGGSVGTGIVICKLEYGAGWSAPCSIAALGGQWGFNIGIQKTDYIMILRTDEAVKTFTSKGQLKLGADVSVAVGPVGRDANIALSVTDKSYAPIVSYSNAKGAYIGIALEGQGIGVRDDCNEAFYGEKFAVDQILNGTVQMKPNADHENIVAIMTAYCSGANNNANANANSNDNSNSNNNSNNNNDNNGNDANVAQ